ncbi:sulfatase-like hydrolase/transferase [Pontibacter pamirensis]|uniref:sulfatase-like hydrolase/transferase n=1 Tax=Pontibacter pamirensis TaxID=2562824 RepID=UPI00138996E0|nr:sulfatase-like hydrolase/transferase [Pontibacter pamirensis]
MLRNPLFLIAVLLFAILLGVGKVAKAQSQPNILWIVSEDNSPLIGAYGDSFATTPHIDKLAREGVLYQNAFASAPVCAPARSTLITGMYGNSMGTENMRSTYPIPSFIKFFPRYLREAGYYTSNNAKKDYNTVDQPEAWDESGNMATYKNRKSGQPFFAVFNLEVSHESSLHQPIDRLKHDPEKVPIPPYHPRTPELKHDWAQYYDKVEAMDAQVGKLLQELEEAGLAESTIVFYYSDHGGVLGRSKRFMYESGLYIPLIIRFPKQYEDLAPGKPNSRTDRIVTFVDFAPTVLSLAGVPAPAHIQGKAFLGQQQVAPREYAYAFRGRMDERFDLVRSVRDKKYRYIRNYMPHKVYAQHISYLWQAPSMRSWETAYRAGQLNETQSRFWEPKPTEELYDVEADPHNVHNLAGQPQYEEVLERLREANRQWLRESRDVGFIPEPIMIEISKTTTLFEYARSGKYPLEEVIETAELASSRDSRSLMPLIQRFNNKEPAVRYWAATGCTVLGKEAAPAKQALRKLTMDPEASVRIAAAEALYQLGEKERAINVLKDALKSDNVMVRVQALNVLENMNEDATEVLAAVRELIQKNPQDKDYDSRAAEWLISKLGNR